MKRLWPVSCWPAAPAAQHHGLSPIIWSCLVTWARSLCVPSATGDMELLTLWGPSALGALLLGRVWNVWTQHLHASNNRRHPAFIYFLFFKRLSSTGCVFLFVWVCCFGFFFQTELLSFADLGEGSFCPAGQGWSCVDREWMVLGEINSVSWKGLIMDWELPLRQQRYISCKHRHTKLGLQFPGECCFAPRP